MRSMYPKFPLTYVGLTLFLVHLGLEEHHLTTVHQSSETRHRFSLLWASRIGVDAFIIMLGHSPLDLQLRRIQILSNNWSKQADFARFPKEQSLHVDFLKYFNRWWNVLALIFRCEKLFYFRQALFTLVYSVWSDDHENFIVQGKVLEFVLEL